MNNIMLNHLRKVNRSITVVSFILAIFSVVLVFIYKMPLLYATAFIYLSVAGFSIYSLYRRKYEILVSYFISFAMCISILMVESSGTSIYLILLPLTMAALYFNLRLFVLCSLSVNLFIIIKFSLLSLFDSEGIIQLIIADIIILLLTFLNKAGKSLIDTASADAIKVTQSLQELNSTMDVIETNTMELNLDITSTYNNLQAVKEISNTMTVSVQEVVVGVSNQAESIDQIYNMINLADEKALETQRTSAKLKEISGNASHLVNSGSEKIKNMNHQMSIISQAVTESVDTVRELQDNMSEINNFLSGIANISKQTNLLALNASIEAARAGESGKGFTVVADEVRKLAEQSASTVMQINQIADNINEKMQLVLDKVQNGNNAVKAGGEIVGEVDDSFARISSSFQEIDEYTIAVQEMMQKTAEVFTKIRSESEGMASIAEEHSAATEEMLSTMEEQNENINSIFELMQKINTSSDNLRGMLQNN